MITVFNFLNLLKRDLANRLLKVNYASFLSINPGLTKAGLGYS